MNKKKIALALAAVTSVAMFAACGGDKGEEKKPGDEEVAVKDGFENYLAEDMSANPKAAQERKDTLIVGTDKPDGVYNPLYSESTYDNNIVLAMFAPLMEINEDGSLRDNMTKSNSVSEDGLTYTFTLKDNLKWSDGTPLTTKDIYFALKVYSDKTYDGPTDLITGKTKLKGAKEYKDGTAKEISGVEIVDDQTIKITALEKSFSNIFSFGTIQPVPEAYYGVNYTQGNASALKPLHGTPGPTSGAFKFVSTKPGQEVVLEANEHSTIGAPKVKKVVFKVTTETSRMSMLSNGEIDMDMVTVSQDNIDLAKQAKFLDYQLFPTNGYGYIAFNMKNEVLADKNVRKALTVGLDREKVSKAVFDDYARVINVPQSDVSWAYHAGDNKYEFKMDEAKKILEDAGWKAGKDGIREKDGKKLKFHFSGTAENPVVDAILASASENWKELGVELTSDKLDFTTIRDKQKKGDYDMMFLAWGMTPDPGSSDNVFKTGGSQNRTAYSNEKIDQLFVKASAELDKEKAKPIYKEIYTIINDELPYMFMYQRSDMWVVNGRVEGMKISPYVKFNQFLHTVTLDGNK